MTSRCRKPISQSAKCTLSKTSGLGGDWRTSLGARRALLGDERLAEHLARRVGIVSRAEQAKILERRRTAERKRVAVLDRDEAPLRAAPPLGVLEGALAAVALEDLPRDFHRDVTGVGFEFSRLARLTRSQAAFQLALEQCVERALEEHGRVAVRYRVAQELPRLLELGVKLGARGEFVAVALGRQRLDARAVRRALSRDRTS